MCSEARILVRVDYAQGQLGSTRYFRVHYKPLRCAALLFKDIVGPIYAQ